MKNYILFIKFIESSRSESTARKYARAINTISDELVDAGVISNNIYIMNDINLIDRLVELYRGVKYLYDKDERGNRMYSSSLKKYAEFYREYYIEHNINEDMEVYELENHVDKPHNAPDTILTSVVERIKRDSSISSSALERVSFLC